MCRRAPPDRGWGFQDAPPLTDLLNLTYRSWWPNNMIPPLIKILAFAVDVRAMWCHVTQPNQQRFCTPSFCEKHLNSESSDYLPLWPNGSDSIYILWIGGIAISSLYVNTLLLYEQTRSDKLSGRYFEVNMDKNDIASYYMISLNAKPSFLI